MWTWQCRWCRKAQALYPELRACSFDRGFHSRDNRVRLDALLDVNALPGSLLRKPVIGRVLFAGSRRRGTVSGRDVASEGWR